MLNIIAVKDVKVYDRGFNDTHNTSTNKCMKSGFSMFQYVCLNSVPIQVEICSHLSLK